MGYLKGNAMINTLTKFNKKYEKLKQLDFVKIIFEKGISLKIDLSQFDSFYSPLEGERWDSFILTYRFFIQKNENISLVNMKKLYNKSILNQVFVNQINREIDALNEFLDSHCPIIASTKKITYREVCEVIIYGHYSHSSKEDEYLKWEKDEEILNLYRYVFLRAVIEVLAVLDLIYRINLEVITKNNIDIP